MRTWEFFSSLTKVTTVQADDSGTDSLENEAVEYLEKKARSMFQFLSSRTVQC